MTTLHGWSIGAALIAAATPWAVVRVALAVARRQAQSAAVPFRTPASVTRLGALTLVATVAAVAAVWTLAPRSPLAGAIDLACFIVGAGFGLWALGDVHEASRPAREVTSATRTASLRPRRLSEHVPVAWRLVSGSIALAGLALLAVRLSSPGPPIAERRLLVPVVLVLAAAVFLWLYEVWMRQEVAAGAVTGLPPSDAGRGTRVRLIFAAELALVLCLTLAGHALLDVDWRLPQSWAGFVLFGSALIGIAGCALAVSSELARRSYVVQDGG